jgi:hypothetical protein
MNEKRNMIRRAMDGLRLEPRVLGFYEHFEQAVAHILSVVISVIIAISLWQLIRAVVALLLLKALNPLDHAVFQTVFGMIMTLLIAMEFRHSIIRVMLRRDHIVQVKTVVLIALLAFAGVRQDQEAVNQRIRGDGLMSARKLPVAQGLAFTVDAVSINGPGCARPVLASSAHGVAERYGSAASCVMLR